jgi:uncharacterized protein YlxW (UPF0749 family)
MIDCRRRELAEIKDYRLSTMKRKEQEIAAKLAQEKRELEERLEMERKQQEAEEAGIQLIRMFKCILNVL